MNLSTTSELTKRKTGRAPFLKKPTTTTLSIEEDLLNRVRKAAYAASQSVSQWFAEAALDKISRTGRPGKGDR